MSKKQQELEIQYLIQRFKEEIGKQEFTMFELAQYAASKGYPLPEPVSPLERLAEKFSRTARQETRKDQTTGQPYRAFHCFPDATGQGFLWVDIDDASRNQMQKAATMRREQMVGDAVQLTLDLDHYNAIHPNQEPIKVALDLEPDVQWRKAGGDAGSSAA